MPYIKDAMSILAECASYETSTTQSVMESESRVNYNAIPEAAEYYFAQPEMVPVVKIGEHYYTEANFLAPFMRDNNINGIAAALEAVSVANGLGPRDVGLLIESSGYVSNMIEKACAKEGCTAKEACAAKNEVAKKIGKVVDLASMLKKKGFPIARKKSPSKSKKK